MRPGRGAHFPHAGQAPRAGLTRHPHPAGDAAASVSNWEAGQPLVFIVRPADGSRTLVLRASSHTVKTAWCAQLLDAADGPAAAGGAKLSTAHAALRRASSSEGAEEGSGGAVAVPRKISTAVFAEEVLGAAAQGSQEGETEHAAAAKQAADDSLVAAIVAQAEQRHLSPAEAALLGWQVLPALHSYVAAAASRLQGMTQRVVASSMLLGRREALYRSLLAGGLLAPGAKPTRLDSSDDAV